VPHKIIIDTDYGDDIDDAIAVSFAAKWPEVEVLAVTTCHVCVRERALMAAKQLRLLGAGHIPCAAGLPRPLAPADADTERRFAERQPATFGFVEEGDSAHVSATEAVDLIHRLLQAHPGQVTLVAIGPLTNVAALFQRHPDTVDLVKAVAMMGGDFPGQRKEYNIACDPEAAAKVFAQPVAKFLGTWDVTRRVVMGQAEINALRASPLPACQGLVRQIDLWWPRKGAKTGPVVYDIAPILWTVDPSFFTCRAHRLDVVVQGADRGRTVESPQGHVMDVSMDMRDKDALDLLMKTLLKP